MAELRGRQECQSVERRSVEGRRRIARLEFDGVVHLTTL